MISEIKITRVLHGCLTDHVFGEKRKTVRFSWSHFMSVESDCSRRTTLLQRWGRSSESLHWAKLKIPIERWDCYSVGFLSLKETFLFPFYIDTEIETCIQKVVLARVTPLGKEVLVPGCLRELLGQPYSAWSVLVAALGRGAGTDEIWGPQQKKKNKSPFYACLARLSVNKTEGARNLE